MAPHTPGSTRTAAPQTPGSWPSHPRMRLYTLFGATGIGGPTWYVSACVSGGREEFLPRLSLQLQVATMGLKWNVERDWELIREVEEEVELPEWLELAQDREIFAVKSKEVADVGLGRFWNSCSKHFEQETRCQKGTLAEFLEAVPTAKFIDVSDAGHMVAGDRNDAFTKAVVGFLRDAHPPCS